MRGCGLAESISEYINIKLTEIKDIFFNTHPFAQSSSDRRGLSLLIKFADEIGSDGTLAVKGGQFCQIRQ